MLPDLADEPVDFDALTHDDRPAIENPLDARRHMIAIEKTAAEHARIKKLRDAVTASYDDELAKLDERGRMLRSSLQTYVERFGEPTRAGGRTVKFPDVGTAFLAKGDPKIEVTDLDAAKEAYAAMFTKPVFDLTDFKRWALEQATNPEVGEVATGVQLVPGGPQLRIRPR